MIQIPIGKTTLYGQSQKKKNKIICTKYLSLKNHSPKLQKNLQEIETFITFLIE